MPPPPTALDLRVLPECTGSGLPSMAIAMCNDRSPPLRVSPLPLLRARIVRLGS